MSGGHQNTAAWDRGIAAENAFLIHTLMHIFWYHYNLFYIQTYIVLLMKHGILNPLNMMLESFRFSLPIDHSFIFQESINSIQSAGHVRRQSR